MPLCNVAVWDETVGNCFLFDCGTPDDFVCVFDPNANYVTGTLKLDRHQFEDVAREHKEKHENQLKALSNNNLWEAAGSLDLDGATMSPQEAGLGDMRGGIKQGKNPLLT